jgi:ribA/ribD-fused uncharacterized protein
MNNIKIKNLRNERPSQPWQVRVDRASILGNPFIMHNESERAKVCKEYKQYFRQSLIKNQSFIDEVTRLMSIYNCYGKLELFCWCAPKQCHAETVKGCIETAITHFRDEHAFLSNMYPCTIKMGKYTFKCAEAAFQAAKCPERAHEFEALDGPAAKALGRKVNLRPDWANVRIKFMHRILKAKFTQNLDLMKKLIHTKNTYLVEGNTWKDTFWGICNGVGHNHLGRLLMAVREDIMKDILNNKKNEEN